MTNPLSRFDPMPKLLDESEIESLARQSGFDAQLLRKLRQQRRRTFALYLSELTAEFRILVREALDRAANDPAIDPSFAGAVLRMKFRFTVSVILLRAVLWLPPGALPGMSRLAVDLLGSLQPLVAPRV